MVKSYSIRIDDAVLAKLHVVADYEGRSANSQVLILIRDCIEAFEAKHGRIEEPSKQKAVPHNLTVPAGTVAG